MPIILGIDAAWTLGAPSGVAIVSGNGGNWACHGTAFSYERFIEMAKVRTPSSGKDLIASVLEAAARLAGAEPDVVAVDMPISLTAISGRRAADTAISKEFGSRFCAAHSPSTKRPGAVGTALSQGLALRGYTLATTRRPRPESRTLIEVYPHPALLSLLNVEIRFEYKVSKSKRYWPAKDREARIRCLVKNFRSIERALSTKFEGIEICVPEPDEVRNLSELKKYEDALDALVCCWVGVRHIVGETVALGDEDAAVWCPRDVVRNNIAAA